MFQSQESKDRTAERDLRNKKLRYRALKIELAAIRRETVRIERIKYGTYIKLMERKRQQLYQEQDRMR